MPSNPWLIHVKAVQKQFPNLPYKEVLTKAKLTYNKLK